MQVHITLPPALAEIARGRDHVLTPEYGRAIGRAAQTIRKEFCEKGEAYGLRPVKIGGRLLWSVSEIAALLRGEK